MKALVFFARDTGLPETPKEIAVEIREFACFNGFNTGNAFRPNFEGYGCDTVFRLDHRGRALLDDNNVARTGMTAIPTGPNNTRRWNCIAIGWLHERGATTFNNFLAQNTMPSYKLGRVLNNETGMPRYYDVESDGWGNTRRERTYNERLLGNALQLIYEHTSTFDAGNNAKTSKFLSAVMNSHRFNYMLFDFVGSERPSGMAVAYLQVYRNASRQWIPSATLDALSMSRMANPPVLSPLLTILGTPGIRSVIPIMADLVHGGSDSDILAHTSQGTRLIAQGCVHGVFSLTEFFRDARSMLQEGRYNKGGQSDHLGTALLRSNNGVWSSTLSSRWGELVSAARGNVEATRVLEGLLSMTMVQRLGASDFTRRITTALEAYGRTPSGAVLRSRTEELVRATGDFRRPPEPEPVVQQASVSASALANAASGFQQWVTSNDNRFGQVVARQQTDADRQRNPVVVQVA